MSASGAISNRSAKSALLNLEIVVMPQKKDNDGFSIYDTEIVLRVFRMVVVIQTFTNDDQLIFPYGFRPPAPTTGVRFVIHRTRIHQLSPSQTRPQPFSRCARQAGTDRILKNVTHHGY